MRKDKLKRDEVFWEVVMKKFISLLFIIIISTFLLGSKLSKLDKLFEEKSSKIQKTFDEKSKKLDDWFAKSLNDEWFQAKFKDAEKLFKEPKPKEIPVAPPQPTPSKPEPTPLVVTPPPPPKPEPVVLPSPVKTDQDEFNVKFKYFGEIVTVPLSLDIASISLNEVNNKTIADYWKKVSSMPHEKALIQLQEYQKTLLQNDWAYLMFIELLTKELYPNKRNLQICYSWFLLIKSGYQARIGYDDKNIYLLLPATPMIYGKTYFVFDGDNYYQLSSQYKDETSGKLYTYPENYPNVNKKLNLKFKDWPKVKDDMKTKTLTFQYNGKDYSLDVQYDNNIIKFAKNFPQTSIDAYAYAPLSQDSANTLLREVGNLIKGKSETEAINILLAFVQKAFAYKTDKEQFGYEKWFFGEETISYPYSDCEDRSVLFSLLVRELMGLDVVLLLYPGHIATAVKFTKDVNGDTIKYNGKRYVICDPTYINATYGQAMPEFKRVKPEVKGI